MKLYTGLSSEYTDQLLTAGQSEVISVDSGEFWLAVCLMLSLGTICGLVAGFLAWKGGANPFNATLRAFGAFAATATLGILFLGLVVAVESLHRPDPGTETSSIQMPTFGPTQRHPHENTAGT